MKKIIFKKELYIKNVGVERYNNTNGWVEFLDGKKIDCYAIYMDGFPLPFKIKPEWCQEFDDLDSEDVDIKDSK